MAQNLDDNKVVNIGDKRGRGRPKGSTKMAQSAKAAAVAEEIMSGKKAAPALGEEGFEEKVIQDTAPSFGSNEPTASVFLQQVNILLAHDAVGEELKLKMSEHRKHRKTLRLGAQERGIVMGDLDQALKDHSTELVDLRAKQLRYLKYMSWLGHDLGIGEVDEPAVAVQPTDTEQDLMRWTKKGDIAGRLGQPRELPKGVPAHAVQAWLLGHENGQRVLMQDSPLTAGAFNADGTAKTAAELKPVAADDGKMVTFTEAHFQTGTILEDANLKTLMPGHHEAFHNAEQVVAVFGDKRRILREPDPSMAGGYYIDTGEEDAAITDPEPVASTASEFA